MTAPTLLRMPPDMYPVHLFHPRFNSLDFWFPAKDAWVLEALCRRVNCDDALEIGSFAGTTASILARHFRHVLCVDTWTGSGPGDQVNCWYAEHDVRNVFHNNIEKFPLDVSIRVHQRTLNPDSLPAKLNDVGVDYDLIFIDAAHDYASVKNDLAIAEQWIADGGIICGHDWSVYEGVTRVVTELGDRATVCGTMWWLDKPFEEMLNGT